MPDIDAIDSTWVGAGAGVVAAALAEPARWGRWWPGLGLVVDEQRGDKGMRWSVLRVEAVPNLGFSGSAEVWLQPEFEGVIAHFFLRLDAAPGRRCRPHHARRVVDRYRRDAKRAFWALGDELALGRVARLTEGTDGRH